MVKGRLKYVPKETLEILERIELFKGVNGSEAFRAMAYYADFGLKFDQSFNWLWGKKK